MTTGPKQRRIAVFMPTWIGDCCMATPTLRALRQKFPNSHIAMIARPVIGELLEDAWGNAPRWYDEVIQFQKRGNSDNGEVVSRLQLPKRIRAGRFDLGILLTNSFWTAATMRLGGIKNIVGYNRDLRGWLLAEKLQPPRDRNGWLPIPAIDYFLRLASHIGCNTTDRHMELAVSDSDQRMAKDLWKQLAFDSDTPTLVFNSNSATQAERVWPKDKIMRVIRQVTQELNWQVLIHCGPGEREQANEIAAGLADPRVASMGICEDLPIGLSKAVLQKASVVVSTDSGPRHLAVALGSQVVTLFGPTDPAWTQTYNRPEILLQPNSTIESQTTSTNGNTRDISVVQVVEAIYDAKAHLEEHAKTRSSQAA